MEKNSYARPPPQTYRQIPIKKYRAFSAGEEHGRISYRSSALKQELQNHLYLNQNKITKNEQSKVSKIIYFAYLVLDKPYITCGTIHTKYFTRG